MKNKKYRLVLPALIVILLFILVKFLWQPVFHNVEVADVNTEDIVTPRTTLMKQVSKGKRNDSLIVKGVSTWEEWIDQRTESVFRLVMKRSPDLYNTEEKVNALRARIRAKVTADTEDLIKRFPDTPPHKFMAIPEDRDLSSQERRAKDILITGIIPHEGPQTPDAIMATYDKWYTRQSPNSVSADDKYPRTEWIQGLLDKGFTFTTQNHYSRMLSMRYHLSAVEDDPEAWTSGRSGVPPQDNFEDYKTAYIERKIWQSEQIDNAAADPDVIGGFFFDNAPDVFLPAKENRVYVRKKIHDGDVVTMNTWGEELSTKQNFDLMYRGEHPEGWEVIYLDENYNVLSEEPPHVTREMVRSWELPPEDWVPPEGVMLPADFEDDLRSRGWKGAWTQEPLPPDRATLARDAAEAERTAEAEWKDFDRAFQEFERLQNMSDTQLEAEFQKIFMSSLPGLLSDESIGKTLQEQFSSARFNNAEKLLQEYGAAEGFRRLVEKDAELARQIEDIYGKRSAPAEENGRFVPKDGPKPPTNAQPPEDKP